MRSIFDDWADIDDGRKRIKLFTGEFPGRESEEIKGSILKKEERYYTLNHIGIDLSCIVAKKRGRRILVDLEVYFNTRVPGKFHDEVSIGWGKAYYFPHDRQIYIEDLNFRHRLDWDDSVIPHHKHKNTIRLWKSFERYLRRTFPDATHITTPDQDSLVRGFKTLLRNLGYRKYNYILYRKNIVANKKNHGENSQIRHVLI